MLGRALGSAAALLVGLLLTSCFLGIDDAEFLAPRSDAAVTIDAGDLGDLDLDASLVDLSQVDAGGCAPDKLARGGLCLPAPVGYWPFDEGTGTTTADASGFGDDATLVNGPLWVAGKVGPFAISFDGVDDRVRIGDPVSGRLDFGTGSFSYAVYVFPTANVSMFDSPWFKGGSSSSFVGYDLELGGGTWVANLNDGTTGKMLSFGNGVLNQWVRLVAVVDRSANKFIAYRDGVMVGSVDITGLGSLSGTVSATIGSAADGSTNFKGAIDDVLVFDTALTAAEAAALN